MFDRNNPYFKQAELLVRILPFIAEKECFAIKGGTAINLFIRDMPRLSVDIDKEFFLSFKSGNPDWKLLGIEVAEKLPAVQWKLINIRKMPDKKRAQALQELKNALEI